MGSKGYHIDLWSQAPICRLGVFVQALGRGASTYGGLYQLYYTPLDK